jgi:hypothetical protein
MGWGAGGRNDDFDGSEKSQRYTAHKNLCDWRMNFCVKMNIFLLSSSVRVGDPFNRVSMKNSGKVLKVKSTWML